MHTPRGLVEHSRVTRSIIEARAPALINLPLPLPSVPVLTPLLSPLIAGNNQQNSGTTTTASATPPAQTSSTSGSGSSNGSGSGNSNGNGNGGGSGNSGGSNNNGNGSGSSSNGSGSGDAGGNGNTSGNGGSSGSSGGSGNGSGSSSSSSNGSGSNGSTGSTSGTGSNSGGSSNNSGSNGTSGSGSESDSAGGSSNGGSSNSGSTGGVNPGSGNANTLNGSHSSSGANASGTSPASSSGTGNIDVAASTPSSSSSTSNLSSNSGASGSNFGNGGNSSGTSGGVANAGSNPDTDSDPTFVGGAAGTRTLGISTPGATQGIGGGSSGTGNGNGSGDPASPSGTSTTESTGASKGGIAPGAIAGISILIFFVLLGVVVIFLRRRHIQRRSDRQRQWWLGRGNNSQNLGDRSSGSFTAVASETRSVRSSFATTYDQADAPRLTIEITEPMPPLPPMAETRGPSLLISLDNSNFQPTNRVTEENRFSIGSASSGASDPYAQYLVVHNNRESTNAEIGTPMSVRPFSPSESFAFPKPPDQTASGDWSSTFSRPQSLATVATNKSPSRSSRNLLDFHALPSSPSFINPFSDANANPFSDPIPAASTSAEVATTADFPGLIPKSEFLEVETIRRPFVPTLHDELSVSAGDRVEIVHIFDDGWAMVNKLPPITIQVEGKATEAGQGQPGLIPIDCLREAGQDLPTFLTAKRVSSYSESNISPVDAL